MSHTHSHTHIIHSSQITVVEILLFFQILQPSFKLEESCSPERQHYKVQVFFPVLNLGNTTALFTTEMQAGFISACDHVK